MRTHFDRHRLLLGGSFILALLAFAGIASGSLGASKPNVYSACVPKNGSIRLVYPGATCKSGERLIRWNQAGRSSSSVGAAGPQGASGDIGHVGNTGSAGNVGASGPAGPAGPIGLTGATGSVGAAGNPGAAGNTGSTGPAGNTGSTGSSGTPGATGPAGPAGSAGAPGATGATGSSQYAEFFALMPSDNAATVAPGTAVAFPQNGPQNGLIARSGPGTFTLPTIGTYRVVYSVSITEAGQLALTLNGTQLPYTVAGRATGTSQIQEESLVTTTVINSVISVVNPSGEAAALTITPLAGGVAPVAASLVVQQLS